MSMDLLLSCTVTVCASNIIHSFDINMLNQIFLLDSTF